MFNSCAVTANPLTRIVSSATLPRYIGSNEGKGVAVGHKGSFKRAWSQEWARLLIRY